MGRKTACEQCFAKCPYNRKRNVKCALWRDEQYRLQAVRNLDAIKELQADLAALTAKLNRVTHQRDRFRSVARRLNGNLMVVMPYITDERRKRKNALADLAAIHASLSEVLGDGEPVELAKRAKKVIEELKYGGCCRIDDSSCTDIPWDDCRLQHAIQAALDAAKGELHGME